MKRARYYIETYDMDLVKFTPQIGVRRGPYTLFGLRAAISALRNLGYPCNYCSKRPTEGDPSVSIWREPARQMRRRKANSPNYAASA